MICSVIIVTFLEFSEKGTFGYSYEIILILKEEQELTSCG